MDAPPKKKKTDRKPPKKITASYLYNAGLAYLERFPASSGHFRAVLMRKVDRSCRHHTDQDRAACAAMVDETVTKFQDMGLLNDDAYVRGMVTSYRRRGLSTAAIKAKLAAKRVGMENITYALADYQEESGADDMSAALVLARRKKIGPFRASSKEISKEKELSALARAGFSYDIAEKVLAMDIDTAEDALRIMS